MRSFTLVFLAVPLLVQAWAQTPGGGSNDPNETIGPDNQQQTLANLTGSTSVRLAVAQAYHEASDAQSGRVLGPIDVVASRDGQTLFVAAADAGQILAVKAERGTTERVIDMPARPTGLVLSTDGRLLFVTCAAPEGTAPYLHDGRFLTVKELLTDGRHGWQDAGTGELSEQQLDDLVTYVLSL